MHQLDYAKLNPIRPNGLDRSSYKTNEKVIIIHITVHYELLSCVTIIHNDIDPTVYPGDVRMMMLKCFIFESFTVSQHHSRKQF